MNSHCAIETSTTTLSPPAPTGTSFPFTGDGCTSGKGGFFIGHFVQPKKAFSPEQIIRRRLYRKKWAERNLDFLKAYRRNYKHSNPAKTREQRIACNRRMRQRAFSHYGGTPAKCLWCGIMDDAVLCLDHINNNGAQERRERGGSGNFTGHVLCRYLVQHGFPKGYQVLCANCNQAKQKGFIFNGTHYVSDVNTAELFQRVTATQSRREDANA